MNQFGGLQAFEQLYGDCYAHVSTTVILKLLKTLGIVEDVRYTDDKDQTYINDLAKLDLLEKQYVQAQNEDNADLDLRRQIDVIWSPMKAVLRNIFDNRDAKIPNMDNIDNQVNLAVAQIENLEKSMGLPTMPSTAIPSPTMPSPAMPSPTMPSPAMPSPTMPSPAMPSPTTASPIQVTLDDIIYIIEGLNSKISLSLSQVNGTRKDFRNEYNNIVNAFNGYTNSIPLDEEGYMMGMSDEESEKYEKAEVLFNDLIANYEKLPQRGGDQTDWINEKIDISNAVNQKLRDLNPYDNANVSKRLSVIEQQRRAIVGQIDQDGNITQPGRNVNITKILASQTRYYRQLYLFIIQHCGVNGGDCTSVFAWLVEQVNSTDINTREMCNNKKGSSIRYSLDAALENAKIEANFMQNEVINKIKERGVKLQTIMMETDDKNNILTREVFPQDEGSGIIYYPNKTKTSDINGCWATIRKLNTKKLYAALSINASCNFCGVDGCKVKQDLSDLTCKDSGPTNHAVTITSIGDSDITIKNSWGIREGEFGKQKYPLTAFGNGNRFGNFSIAFIDTVNPEQTVQPVQQVEPVSDQSAGKKFYRMKSKKNNKKSKKRKSKKRKNRSNKRVRKFSK
jgi:hypothetical protein